MDSLWTWGIRLLAVGLLCVPRSTQAQDMAPFPVEGDVAALEAWRESYDPALKRFDRGRMVAHVDIRSVQAKEHTVGDVELIWDGSRTRWNYTMVSTHLDTGKTTRGSSHEWTLVETPAGTISYGPAAKLIVIAPPNRSGIPEELRLRPDHVLSCGKFSYKARSWYLLLNPATTLNPAIYTAAAVDRFAENGIRLTYRFHPEQIVRENGKVIGVIRGMPNFVVEGSLNMGGVVTGFASEPYQDFDGSINPGVRGGIVWSPDSKGRPCVKSFSHIAWSSRESNPEWKLDVTVSQYEHDPQIPKGLFDRSSLPVSDGWTIREISSVAGQPARETRVGNLPSGVGDKDLDSLGRAAKQGFADPNRK